MGWFRLWRRGAVAAAAALSMTACAGSSESAASPAGPSPGPLSLVRSGAILHAGSYCRFLQQASPGNNTLPVANGCQFNLTTPVDLFATDGGGYSVSEVVGDAQVGVRGPDDARTMIVCRLAPRAQFWFWISADGNWNVDRVDDVHHPVGLVGADRTEPLRQYVKPGGQLNHVQFRCAGGQKGRAISLALNVNDHQFTALTVPMPADGAPLTRPAIPWFVDLGARLTSQGTLEGTIAKVTLYDHE